MYILSGILDHRSEKEPYFLPYEVNLCKIKNKKHLKITVSYSSELDVTKILKFEQTYVIYIQIVVLIFTVIITTVQ